MDASRSSARIFRTPGDVIRRGRDITMPWDGNTAVAAARLTPPVLICYSTRLPNPEWEPRDYQPKGSQRYSMDQER